ncbi:MAG: GHMP kinase [bacterium]|nr:GHMP kinase [bacterium]
MTIKTTSFARAGLLGNPSDGYYGKTISVIVKNFSANVILRESRDLEIKQNESDLCRYSSLNELVRNLGITGYYGGTRLIKAVIKTFHDYCTLNKIILENKNFTIEYSTTIPRQIGLGGSSAIVTAALRALMEFYGVKISIEIQPNIILSAEKDELAINAGLQDRVIQVYEGCVYMDFNKDNMDETKYGIYEKIDPGLLTNLFIAYKTDLGKVSGSALSSLQSRFESKDPSVIKALNEIANLAVKGKQTLMDQNMIELSNLMKENFYLRKQIMQINESNLEMIRTAEECGTAAKFAGSGGSVIGIYKDEKSYDKLVTEMKKINAEVIKPVLI